MFCICFNKIIISLLLSNLESFNKDHLKLMCNIEKQNKTKTELTRLNKYNIIQLAVSTPLTIPLPYKATVKTMTS